MIILIKCKVCGATPCIIGGVNGAFVRCGCGHVVQANRPVDQIAAADLWNRINYPETYPEFKKNEPNNT